MHFRKPHCRECCGILGWFEDEDQRDGEIGAPEMFGELLFLPPECFPHKSLHPIPPHRTPGSFRNCKSDPDTILRCGFKDEYAPNTWPLRPLAARKDGLERPSTAQRLAPCHAMTFNAVGGLRYRILFMGRFVRELACSTVCTGRTDMRIVLMTSAG